MKFAIRATAVLLTILFSVCSLSFAWPVPDTGQTKCYDNEKEIPCPQEGEAFYGQDANYTINPMSYTKLDANGNDLPDDAGEWVMVRDNVTGLIWEVKTYDGSVHNKNDKYSWQDAQDVFIAQLNDDMFGGYSDWRMPTPEELHSILDYSIPFSSESTIDKKYFPNTSHNGYWSSAPYSYDTNKAWSVFFIHGSDDFDDKSTHYSVRAVHNSFSDPIHDSRFVDNGDGTVTDTSTGLIWEKDNDKLGHAFKEALNYCENLTLAGHNDWRMPTIKELSSLVDLRRHRPSIDPVLENYTVSSHYWSSTTDTLNTNWAWIVNFKYGNCRIPPFDPKSSYCFVRAVRGGRKDGVSNNLIVAQRPETCSPGTTITQWGTGFTPGGTATLHIFDESGTEIGTDTAVVRSDGSFEILYTVPDDKPIGIYTWYAIDENTGGKSNTAPYRITEDAFPEISNVPKRGTVNTVFEQTGTGFTSGGTATLYFFNDSGESTGTKQVTVGADGAFKVLYDPDDDKESGRYYWYAVDETTGNKALEVEYWIEEAGQQEEPQPPADATPITEGGVTPMTPLQAAKGYLMEWDALDEEFYAFENNQRYNFDADRSVTTILVHGWTRDNDTKLLKEKKWVKYMALWLHQKANDKTNVLAYNWLEDSKSGLVPPAINVMEYNSDKLSKQLKEYLPENYSGKLHFIAHSAGSYVAHRAVNRLVTVFDTPVDQLTMLDAFVFDLDSFVDGLVKPEVFDVINPGYYFADAFINIFETIPLSKASFVDHYSTGVGSLSNIFAPGFWISNTIKGSGAFIVDCANPVSTFVFDSLFKYKNYPEPDYFFKGLIDFDSYYHKPPVNWYMSSIVDQLDVSGFKTSENADENKYGFYWSPIFSGKHSRPNKYDIEILFGADCYFDLIGSSQVGTDLVQIARTTAVKVKEGVDATIEKGRELKERLENKAQEIGTTIKVKSVEVFTTSKNWISSKASNVKHSIKEKMFWMKSGSPVALSTQYLIPSDASNMAFSFKVLQADAGDVIDVYINKEVVWSKIVEEDLNNGILLSNWIDITYWRGQTVDLMFQIHSPDGLPLIIELYDMVFADLGNVEEVLTADTDNDDMGDMWEIHYFGNAERDGTGDEDNDGLKDSEEFTHGTAPNNSDSDNDGKNDFEEIQSGSNPLDSNSVSTNLTANAGLDRSIKEETSATLNGYASNAADGTISYQWRQTGGPDVKLSDPNISQPSFTAPQVGEEGATVTFQLTVTDSTGATASDTCAVSIWNEGPGDDGGGCFISAIRD